jgi:hypothetical protein
VLGSLLTRPYRFATRGAELTIRGTLGAIELAENVLAAVAERVVGGSHNGHAPAEPEMTPVTQMPPDTRTPERPPGPDASLGQETRPSTEGPPAPEPPPVEPALDTEGPASAPEPLPAARRPAAETGGGEAAVPAYNEPTPPEPAHVSEEPELVEEFAEPGAEEGVGAQLRILEPWTGYSQMKAADVIARLASSSREEIAAVELYELAGRNRKSVVAAAQRALKQASPPR